MATANATSSSQGYSWKQGDNIDLQAVIDEFFLVLSQKEQHVITKRFSLDSKPKQTLERIGEHFSVTRERIRQIESIALQKLRRNVANTQLQKINLLAKEILTDHGGIMREKDLLAAILNITHIRKEEPINGNIIKLGLAIDNELQSLTTSKVYFPFWRESDISLKSIDTVASTNHKTLKKIGDVTAEKTLLEKVQKNLKEEPVSPAQVQSILSIDRRFRKMKDDAWGLMSWRHVNPRSIRDKAAIVLKKEEKPMHFIAIANKISEVGFDKKTVTIQAVHNELIRYEQFVLVGRGMYALSEWGYEPGTVADVICRILKKEGPMKKKDIVTAVKKQRDVKLGTISLNLQKQPAFVRVGRAVYDFDESKWKQPKRGRGRAKMKNL